MAAIRPDPLAAESALTPDEALLRLMEGNERFASDAMTESGRSLSILRQHTVEKQEPFACVLSCSDSRVPVELVFDQSIGQLFVARVAGNFLTPEIVGTLEYGAALLGTKLIMVLGHASCGAVTAAMAGEERRGALPGQIGSLIPHIKPAVERAGGDLATAVRENARLQAELLAKSSPLLAGLVNGGKLKIVAGYYELATGRVSLID